MTRIDTAKLRDLRNQCTPGKWLWAMGGFWVGNDLKWEHINIDATPEDIIIYPELMNSIDAMCDELDALREIHTDAKAYRGACNRGLDEDPVEYHEVVRLASKLDASLERARGVTG